MIEPLRRASLHAIALSVLRAEGADPARLAHHAEATGDAEAVTQFAPLAATEAAARSAHREAAAQYRRALNFSAHLDAQRRAELLEQGAHEVYLIDQFDAAIQWLIEAVELRHQLGDVRLEGDAVRRLSTVQRCGGRRTDADANGAKAVNLLQGIPPGPELAAAFANAAMLAMNASEIEPGVVAAQQALDVAATCGDGNVRVHALNTKGVLALLAGDEGGLATLEESLRVAMAEGRDDHVGRAYVHLADIAQRHRRWDIIDRYYVPGTEYLIDHGLDLWARYLHVYYTRTELDRGRWEAAVSAIPTSVDVPGTPLARINALVVLGLVRARRGDPGYRPVLDEAGYLAERSGELQWVGPVAAARAEAAWLHDEGAAFASHSDRALQACIDNGAGWWAGEIAWWRRCAGVDEPAPECAAEPWALLLAGRAGESAAMWRQLGCPYEDAIALSHSDDHDDLRAAFELFDSLGADPASALLVRQMRQVGVRGIPRGVRSTTRANPAGLTTRELDVLRLLAQGLRNSEIADQLVVSTKTVDHHVSSVLSKLGVSGRAAAAKEAVRLGLQDGELSSPR